MNIPETLHNLFWEVDPKGLNAEVHRDYIIERLMSRGGLEAMRWLRASFSVEVLRSFLLGRGAKLDPRLTAYWFLITNTPRPEQLSYTDWRGPA